MAWYVLVQRHGEPSDIKYKIEHRAEIYEWISFAFGKISIDQDDRDNQPLNGPSLCQAKNHAVTTKTAVAGRGTVRI